MSASIFGDESSGDGNRVCCCAMHWLYPCDDASITLKAAVNFAHGRGLVVNAGENVFAVTCQLWGMLTGELIRLGMNPQSALTAMSVLSSLTLTTVILWGFSGRIWAGVMAIAILWTNPVFVHCVRNGMETPLFAAVILGACLAAGRGKFWVACLLAGLAVWVRFDGLILIAVLFPYSIYKSRSVKTIWAGALLLVCYAAFTWIAYGSPIPTSVAAKAGFGSFRFAGSIVTAKAFLLAFGGWFWDYAHNLTPHWLLIPFIVLGMMKADSKYTPLVLFAWVYMAAYIFAGRGYAINFPWYFVPPVVALTVPASAWIADKLPMKRSTPVLAAVVWIAAVAHPLMQAWDHDMLRYENREGLYEEAMVKLNRILPPKAVVAGHEIGTIAFYSREDIYILDTFGIARPDAGGVDAETVFKMHQPDAIITREAFHDIDMAQKLFPGQYRWRNKQGVVVGLRVKDK